MPVWSQVAQQAVKPLKYRHAVLFTLLNACPVCGALLYNTKQHLAVLVQYTNMYAPGNVCCHESMQILAIVGAPPRKALVVMLCAGTWMTCSLKRSSRMWMW